MLLAQSPERKRSQQDARKQRSSRPLARLARCLLVALCSLSALPIAHAGSASGDTKADANAGADAGADACIDVEVNGQRTLSIQCLNEQLRPRGTADRLQTAPSLASERVGAMSSNQLGLYNRAALINRMGSNFGRSAHPYRPAPVESPPPPLLRGRQGP